VRDQTGPGVRRLGVALVRPGSVRHREPLVLPGHERSRSANENRRSQAIHRSDLERRSSMGPRSSPPPTPNRAGSPSLPDGWTACRQRRHPHQRRSAAPVFVIALLMADGNTDASAGVLTETKRTERCHPYSEEARGACSCSFAALRPLVATQTSSAIKATSEVLIAMTRSPAIFSNGPGGISNTATASKKATIP